MSPKSPVKDLSASVRARLLNMARRQQIDFNRLLLLYFQQCFLDRLAHSKYKEKFILKGGLLFYGIEPLLSRPTKDIDLLGRGILNEPEAIAAAVREMVAKELPDGVTFFPKNVGLEVISEKGAYTGVRITFPASLGAAKQNLQIDVGFGDRIVPGAVEFDYPDLLSDRKIEIYAYSWSSVIAEKFEAIVRFSDLSSRMKDYYDIDYLQSHFNFDGRELSRAVEETFKRRNSDVSDAEYIFSRDFAQSRDKQKQWRGFLRKNALDSPVAFSTALVHLKNFLEPVVSAILRQKGFDSVWNFKSKQWLKKS